MVDPRRHGSHGVAIPHFCVGGRWGRGTAGRGPRGPRLPLAVVSERIRVCPSVFQPNRTVQEEAGVPSPGFARNDALLRERHGCVLKPTRAPPRLRAAREGTMEGEAAQARAGKRGTRTWVNPARTRRRSSDHDLDAAGWRSRWSSYRSEACGSGWIAAGARRREVQRRSTHRRLARPTETSDLARARACAKRRAPKTRRRRLLRATRLLRRRTTSCAPP